MVNPKEFVQILADRRVNSFFGVPDSLLKVFISELEVNPLVQQNIVAANEGNAVSLAAGSFLARGEIPCVYLQNSGLGNALNPLLSLCDREVHRIPILLIVGWRGEKRDGDEPQHMAQGRMTLPILDMAQIPYRILSKDANRASEELRLILDMAHDWQSPAAIVIREGTFSESQILNLELPKSPDRSMNRQRAMDELFVWSQQQNAATFVTTGHTAREILSYYGAQQIPNRHFLNVGAMGHVSQLALGFALQKPEQRVLCIDGDASLLMHMGAMATIARQGPKQFVHVVLNNNAHGSVGGQSTCSENLSFSELAKTLGYSVSITVDHEVELKKVLEELDWNGPVFIEIKVGLTGERKLPRPSFKPFENRMAFMKEFSEEVDSI